MNVSNQLPPWWNRERGAGLTVAYIDDVLISGDSNDDLDRRVAAFGFIALLLGLALACALAAPANAWIAVAAGAAAAAWAVMGATCWCRLVLADDDQERALAANLFLKLCVVLGWATLLATGFIVLVGVFLVVVAFIAALAGDSR